jgi:ABC-type Fe3+/spermidine/putrescine transport system ATPase subunit
LILRLQSERRVTTLIVTHDRDEAAEMGQEIALMIEGRIVQRDTPRELFLRPSSPAVARFFGARNLLSGEVRGGFLRTEAGPVPVPGPDGRARVSVRAESLVLGADGPLRMTVSEATFVGSGLRVRLTRGAMRLEARIASDPVPEVGDEVGVTVPADAVWRFPGDRRHASGDGMRAHAGR